MSCHLHAEGICIDWSKQDVKHIKKAHVTPEYQGNLSLSTSMLKTPMVGQWFICVQDPTYGHADQLWPCSLETQGQALLAGATHGKVECDNETRSMTQSGRTPLWRAQLGISMAATLAC